MSYSTDFVKYGLSIEAIKLVLEGLKLKSGRISPYFFNSSLFCTGETIRRLARAYYDVIFEENCPDVIFGPSYKGSALAVATVLNHGGTDLGYAYNRKEAKDHGEGGIIIGASVKGKKVFLIDDVMTTGESLAEGLDIVIKGGGTPIGCAIAFDRQERGVNTELSAVQEFEKTYKIPVLAIATLADLIAVMEASERYKDSPIYYKILDYQKEYGIRIP